MNNDFLEKRLKELSKLNFFNDLVINRGIEKEFFRVNRKGDISEREHPQSLGSALTNKFITTDFAEAQLELVTPTFDDIDDLHAFLTSLHIFVIDNINEDETVWPLSMPPHIKDESKINLGYYHQSNIGLLKHVYRKGLKVRYGSTMQCVSGMHYNFSINNESLSKLSLNNSQEDYDEIYLGLIRNFKRIFWFVLSEFGQTNVVDKSFVNGRFNNLSKLSNNDMYQKNATSLRMSDIGYVSDAQKNLNIKYNSLEEFLRKIRSAITDPYPDFQNKGLIDNDGEFHQISDGIIQIENEYYDSIRPKRASEENLRPYNQLKKFGIEYLEIRGIDIDPNEPTGISKNHIKFLDMILIYCLICPSKDITNEEKLRIDENDKKTVYDGRDYGIKLSINSVEETLGDAREKIYSDLIKLACCFGNSESLIDAINYVKTYSRGMLPKTSYHEYGLNKAKEVVEFFKKANDKYAESIKMEAELSIDKLNSLQKNSSEEMNEYVKNYNINL